MTTLSNTPYESLVVGMEAASTRACTADDLYVFANSSGNHNPMHLPREDGDGDGTPEAVALVPESHTGRYLAPMLKPGAAGQAAE